MEEENYINKPAKEILFEMNYPKSKQDYTKKCVCPLCGGTYTYSNSAKHKKTKIHKLYENMNSKLIEVLKLRQ